MTSASRGIDCQPIFTVTDAVQFRPPKKTLIKRAELRNGNIFTGLTIMTPWNGYRNVDYKTAESTFDYIFSEFKKGIFASFYNGNVSAFIPFVNVRYKNDWHRSIKFKTADGTITTDETEIRALLETASIESGHRVGVIKPMDEWYANNSMIRYDAAKDYGRNLCELRDMYETLAATRDVPDIQVFVNKRDFPLITRDGTAAYNHLYGSKLHVKDGVPDKFLPVLSGSGNSRFADVIVPTYEDWARAVYQSTGKTFPNGRSTYPDIPYKPLGKKISRAVFRGSSTGSGTDVFTNQRLRACQLSVERPDLVDAKITKWNTRPRKHESSDAFKILDIVNEWTGKPLTPAQQSEYKYILNVQGHVAAYRLSYELSFGSVVLMVESEWKMWFQRLIHPYIHYVPVKADMSDLFSVIEWCEANPDECQTIADNARSVYDRYLGTTGILDFLQKTLIQLSQESGRYYYPNDVESIKTSFCRERLITVAESRKWTGQWTYARRGGVAPSPPPVPVSKTEFYGDALTLSSGGGAQWVDTIELRTDNDVRRAFYGMTLADVDANNFVRCYGALPRGAQAYGALSPPPLVAAFEKIRGPSLREAIKRYSVDDVVKTLTSLCLGLKMAQDAVAFIHGSANVDNVFIAPSGGSRHYVIDGSTLKTRYESLPILTDYSKSSLVSAASGRCLIYGTSVRPRLYDVVTLMASCVDASPDPRRLASVFKPFFDKAGFKYAPDQDNVNIIGRFNLDEKMTPMSFVDFAVARLGVKIVRSAPVTPVGITAEYKFFTDIDRASSSRDRAAAARTLKRMSEKTFARPVDPATADYAIKIIRPVLDFLSRRITAETPELMSTFTSVASSMTSFKIDAAASIDSTLPDPAQPYDGDVVAAVATGLVKPAAVPYLYLRALGETNWAVTLAEYH